MKKIAMLVVVLIACVGCDQITIHLAKQVLEPGTVHSIASDTLRIVYAENAGAFLGLGASLPEALRSVLFIGIPAALLCALSIFLISSRTLSRKKCLAGALLLGGGLSNFLDRLLNDGIVIDFINLGIGGLRTGIFNIADVAIMLGAIYFVWPTRTGVRIATR